MGNKAAWSENQVFWPEGQPAISVTGTGIGVPDSAGFCPITAGSSQNVDIIDAEWSPGRVIEFWVVPGSSTITFRDNQAGTNIVLNGTSVAAATLSSISFRAWRDASGNKRWYQIRGAFTIAS